MSNHIGTFIAQRRKELGITQQKLAEKLNKRKAFLDHLKECTVQGGIHAVNAFVRKPFIEPAPDMEEAEKQVGPWHSGRVNLRGTIMTGFFIRMKRLFLTAIAVGLRISIAWTY